ncbi:DUF3742 family protein [Thauera sinica]|uniref:DUF3742 family protein n=1 Tax=Thauera sinica TaxID=2665146 RepID=A0ABW1AY77_9RHOO|nr:DUF3742 family protein [Thauera sp. K11]ATE58722.1 DUF3742 domain-containing protein [Thauera sp. K11]
MATNNPISNAERFGRWLGRGWYAYARGERRVSDWLVVQGLPAGAAVALLWVVKLVVLGMLAYAAFWLALLVVFVVAAAWAAEHVLEKEEYGVLRYKTEQQDHRQSLFYDPINYNDDPDPRFDDH